MARTNPGKETPIGRQLRSARLAAGVATAREAAQRAGFQPSFVWKLETTKVRPAWESVRRLIEANGLPLERFFGSELILAAAKRIGGKAG